MKSNGFVKILLLVVIVLLLGVIGFLMKDSLPLGFTDIAQVVSSPQSYEGHQVKIRGQVVDTLKIPFIDAKRYVLDDGTGEISVATNLSLPVKGSHVAIVAIGTSAAIIGGESIGFRLQEVKKLPEYLSK